MGLPRYIHKIFPKLPNPIKYSASAQTLALKKGNYWIGTGDVGKGPTSTTDYYNGITPPSGGYTIYLNKASGGPSIYTAANDSQLISLSNTIAGQTFATAAAALDWYNGQTDKMVFNRDYESIVTNGLVLNLDAGFSPSYPTTGTTWYDVSSGGNTGTLTNGPTFNSSSGGWIVFDGVDDYLNSSLNIEAATSSNLQTFCSWLNGTSVNSSFFGSGANGTGQFHIILNFQSDGQLRFAESYYGGGGGSLDQTNLATVSANPAWNYACVVKTGISTFDVYFNGSKVISNATKAATSSAPFSLGRWWTGMYIPSRISSIQVYNRALSASEVLQNYNAQKSRFGL